MPNRTIQHENVNDPDAIAAVKGDLPLDGKTGKYVVTKTDGSPVDPNAQYLVLRIDNKLPSSPECQALETYLTVLDATGRFALAGHLRAFYGMDPYNTPPSRFMRPNQLGEGD